MPLKNTMLGIGDCSQWLGSAYTYLPGIELKEIQ